jgi:probable F420-dependent oxidoreductase
VRVEALGFDYLASGEHVVFHGPTLNAFIALATAAGVTRRIKLLSGITLLPLYPAVLVAKMASVLDVVSGGRFNLGIGSGGDNPAEFAACGIPVTERVARADEGVEIVRALLAGANVSFRGRFADLDGVVLEPAPVQAAVPIWVAGRKASAMRRAARHGDFWFPYLMSPGKLAESVATVADHARLSGREPASIRTALLMHLTVYESASRACEVAAETLSEAYRQDFSHLVNRVVVAGDAAFCRERINEYREAGAQAIIFQLMGPPADRRTMLDLLADRVLPGIA